MGEYTATFHVLPLRMTLAPSTRLYGSVEVYDPKEYAPRIHIGDVLLAVNGDTGAAKWPMDDTINHIANLQVTPVTITFRRPMAYREYLETYFKQTRATVSSRSTSTAMFPESAEYKHGHVYKKTAAKMAMMTPPQRRHGTVKHKRTHGTKSDHVKGQGRLTKEQWLDVSKQLDATDQFKLWQSRASKRNAAKKAKANKGSRPDSGTEEWIHTSAMLTERHVQYLWAHLPAYLTCNDMELVYDTRRHGWNLLSFYSHVQDKGPTLLVVKDTRDQIFGAFSSTSWQQSSGDVYGNGRCFVFTLRPQMHVYAWSGLNDTFMSGRRDAILMGGGTKGIALCVQLDELRGFSTPCETFDSPSLASSQGRGDGVFEMEHLEVWCFSGLRV
jgi:TBC1 domain family member 24